MTRANTEADFWARVEMVNDGCWLWRGAIHSCGRYGAMWFNQRLEFAHRLAYRFAKGPIPNGSEVRHSCDNGFCVRPGHLSLGSHADNMRDAVVRGRSARGERSGTAKLTATQVDEVRRRRASGESTTALGRAFGVHSATVSRITRGEQRVYEAGPRVAAMSYTERGRLSHGSLGPIAARTDVES